MSADILDSAKLEATLTKVLDKKLEQVVEMETLRRTEYLGADDIAKLFSLEKNTLNTQRSRGVGPPYIKLGSKVLYSTEAVRAYLEKHAIKTIPQ